MSVPADTPAEVTYLPASTHRATLSQSTSGPCGVTQPNAEWLVAAGRPSKNPHFARTAAPVQTEAMMRTFLSIARIQSRRIATDFGSDVSSSSGQVPPPPGTIKRSRGCFNACAKSQSGATDGPLALFTFAIAFAISTVSKGSGGGAAQSGPQQRP